MDSRISLLNKLKKRLNNLLTGNKTTPTGETHTNEWESVRALLMINNIQAGLAIDNNSFGKSDVYAVISKEDSFRFHIYPFIPQLMTIKNEVEAIHKAVAQ